MTSPQCVGERKRPAASPPSRASRSGPAGPRSCVAGRRSRWRPDGRRGRHPAGTRRLAGHRLAARHDVLPLLARRRARPRRRCGRGPRHPRRGVGVRRRDRRRLLAAGDLPSARSAARHTGRSPRRRHRDSANRHSFWAACGPIPSISGGPRVRNPPCRPPSVRGQSCHWNVGPAVSPLPIGTRISASACQRSRPHQPDGIAEPIRFTVEAAVEHAEQPV